MAQPIIFTITEAGKQAALDANADSAQLKINLTQVAVGTGKRTVTGNESALLTEIKRGSIVSGDVEVSSNTLRFTSSMTSDAITGIYEVGLMTDDNVLFALASSTTDPLFSLHPNITFVIGFGLSLSDVAADSVTVTTDPNGSLAIVIMEQHLAALDPHPQYINESRFQEHLDADNPHSQYVFQSDYDQHVTKNDDEHQGFTDWQQQHLVAFDPHDQYVLKTAYDDKIGELISRLNMLANAINNNAVEDEYSVALLSLRVEHKVFSDNPSAVTTRVTETQKVGLNFASYTNSLPVSQSQQSPTTYEFSVYLPASYDASIHRILALGGQAHRVESNRVVFELLTNVVAYTYSPGGDQNDQTGYRSTIDTTVQVEMFSSLPPAVASGTLVGLIDVTYADTASSANDSSGSGTVTLNDASGYPFAYPLTVDLANPVTNTPQPYDLDTKIILPVEYDSAKHDLTVTNSAGSYLINQADRSIDFSSSVTSVKQADDEVLDTLNTTLRVEIKTK